MMASLTPYACTLNFNCPCEQIQKKNTKITQCALFPHSKFAPLYLTKLTMAGDHGNFDTSHHVKTKVVKSKLSRATHMTRTTLCLQWGHSVFFDYLPKWLTGEQHNAFFLRWQCLGCSFFLVWGFHFWMEWYDLKNSGVISKKKGERILVDVVSSSDHARYHIARLASSHRGPFPGRDFWHCVSIHKRSKWVLQVIASLETCWFVNEGDLTLNDTTRWHKNNLLDRGTKNVQFIETKLSSNVTKGMLHCQYEMQCAPLVYPPPFTELRSSSYHRGLHCGLQSRPSLLYRWALHLL